MRTKKLEKIIKKYARSDEEKMEMWAIVDEIVHHRIIGCVLEDLPQEKHEEFLGKLNMSGSSESLIYYLNENVGKEVGTKIGKEIEKLEEEIFSELTK